MINERRITIRLSENLMNEIKSSAKDRGTTISRWIRKAIIEKLKYYESMEEHNEQK